MGSADSLGTDQRAKLYRTKLTSLVRSHFSPAQDPEVWGFGAGALATLADRSLLLIEGDDASAAFGAGLIKARGAEQIDVWVEAASTDADAATTIARQAQAIRPVDSVSTLRDHSVVSVQAAEALPLPLEISDSDPLIAVMRDAGLEVQWRHGVPVGTLRGLEAARITTNIDGSRRLDVGVGHYDQEAFAMMNADLPQHEALAEVVRQITELRVADAPSHPINRLGRARWLADTIRHDPSLIGAATAQVVDVLPDRGIRNESPVSLSAATGDGETLAVTVAVGLEPLMLPAAAEAVVTLGAQRAIFVVPERDRYPLLDELAEMLTVPAEVRSIPVPW